MKKLEIAILLIINAWGLVSCTYKETEIDKKKLLPYDYRLFQGTPAWELAQAVNDGDEEAIIRIVNNNPKIVNAVEPIYGYSVLHLSIMNQNLKSFQALIESNADVNKHAVHTGETPLNFSCDGDGNKIEIVRILIENGANVNDVDSCKTKDNKNTYSALMLASRYGFYEAVKLLLSKGADINYTNLLGSNALNESIIQGNYKIAYYLLEHGADYNKPVFTQYKYFKSDSGIVDSIAKRVYIKEELEWDSIYYLTPERKYYYKIVDFFKSKGIKINESGKRNFDVVTFAKEIWQSK